MRIKCALAWKSIADGTQIAAVQTLPPTRSLAAAPPNTHRQQRWRSRAPRSAVRIYRRRSARCGPDVSAVPASLCGFPLTPDSPTCSSSQMAGAQPPPPRWPLHPPVVALFAQLLLEVAQGETVAAHAPPVRDLLAAEEIRHHGLGAARPVAAEALLALLPAEGSQRGRGGRVRALAVPTRRRSEDTTEMVDLS